METTRFESLYPENSREEEIKKILAFVKAGLSCQVIGLPGVGRSNLLGLLAYNRQVRLKHLGEGQKDFHFIYLNFAEVKEAGPLEFNKFLFIHLLQSLEERKYQKALEKIQNLFKESLDFGEPLFLWQNLKKAVDILTNQERLFLVFLFIRFEEYQKKVSAEFFLNLRTLRSLAKYRFAAVFALSRPLEKSLDPAVYQEFYESIIGHLVYLPIYDKTEMDFRLSHLEKVSGQKLNPQVRQEILALTGGHGKLTRICLETLFSSPASFGKGKIKEFLASQPLVSGVLLEIWRSLTPSEQTLAQKVARREKVEEGPDLEFLINLDLVKKMERTLALNIPLLSSFSAAIVKSSQGKIYFNLESNEILKGERVISDGLTAQEFRLLRFLLENPGRVCEREEIILAVWPETKTTEGVSDEAIDQMVFRLRKKTEEDPKNPRCLQTVKGRGFRFLP